MQSKRVVRLSLTLLAAVGILTAIACTRVGVSPDSVFYLNAARNFVASGRLTITFGESLPGASSYLAQYPPGLPVLLAVPGLFGVDAVAAGRWLNALLLGATIFLVGSLLYRQTRQTWTAVLGAFLTLTAVNVLNAYTYVWSEPLFIVAMLLCLLALNRYAESMRWPALVLAGLCAGAAMLARYAGAAVIGAGAIGVLLFAPRPRRRRLLDVALFLVPAGLPAFAWLARNTHRAGTATNRPLVFHPPGWEYLAQARDVMSMWIFPYRLPLWTQTVGLLAVITAVLALAGLALGRDLRLRRQDVGERSPVISSLALLVACGYAALLVVTVMLFDAWVLPSQRMFLPLFVLGLVTALSVMSAGMRALGRTPRRRRFVAVIAAALCLLMAVRYTVVAAVWCARRAGDGGEYTSRAWRASPLISRVAALPPEAPVYSNLYDAVYFLTGRPALITPRTSYTVSAQANPRQHEDVASLRRVLAERRGYVAWFHGPTQRPYFVRIEVLEAAAPLTCVARTADGALYELADGGKMGTQ